MQKLEGDLIIFHAGSLSVPVQALTEAFQSEYPDVMIKAEAAGSRITARKVRDQGRPAHVVMSADDAVIDRLLIPAFARWNVRFARNAMVIAYADRSAFADEVSPENWHEVLTREGVTCGHSDPNADPCGYRTLMVWQLAERHYDHPGLYDALDAHCPQGAIRPKETDLIVPLQSGEMDYIFTYRSVAVQHELDFIELPDEIDLSAEAHADLYSRAEVTVTGAEAGEALQVRGKPIAYGVTVPNLAPDPELAHAFVEFLLGPKGQAILENQGQPPIVPARTDQTGALPASLKRYVA